MFKSSVENLKMICSAALILPCLIGCQNGFKSFDVQNETSAEAWTQAQVIDSASSVMSIEDESAAGAYCIVTAPDQFRRDEELRASAASQNIVHLQVSVNGGEFVDLPTMNGTMSWAGNSFEVAVYHLRFRGLMANGTAVDCSPSSKVVTITAASVIPTMPTTPSVPATPPPGNSSSAIVDKNYIPLTGYSSNGSATDNGFKNFKTIYHPDNIKNRMVYKLAPGVECHMIDTNHSAMILRTASATQKYRIFLPPGTMSTDITTYTYWDTTTQQAVAVRMDSAPVSSYEQTLSQPIVPDGDRVLERLVNGEEFRSYVAEGGNLLPRIGGGTNYSGATPYVYRSSRGGWLYMNQLKLIGDVAMRIETRTCVDPEIYRAWYNSAQWDSDGNPL